MIYSRAQYFLIPSLLVASLFSPSLGVAQDAAPAAGPTRLSLPEIVDNMAKTNAQRAKDLEHYQGKREYRLDYKGFPEDLHADMVVRVSYSAPSTVEFTEVSQSGSKLILNRVIKPIMADGARIDPARELRQRPDHGGQLQLHAARLAR